MVDPGNRLVADTIEANWNDKLRALAKARDEREGARREDQLVIDGAVRARLVSMTTDFKQLWSDPSTANRDRKRMLAYVIEDATLLKPSARGGDDDPCPIPWRSYRNADNPESEGLVAERKDTAAHSGARRSAAR